MRRVLILRLAVVLVAVLAGLLTRTAVPDLDRAARVQITISKEQRALQTLAGALKHKTVGDKTKPNHVSDRGPFDALQQHLKTSFASVFQALELDVNEHSLLLCWKGSSSEDPVVFISHLDVVPAGDAAAEGGWAHGPFSGDIADGYVWGRGALDVKVSAVALLEAVAHLLAEGFKPERTAYLAFGHDEELSGKQGARAMAKLLKSRGVKPQLFMDEGGALLLDGLPPIVQGAPVAVVSVAEKGHVGIDISARGHGGHSMYPAASKELAVERLAKVLRQVHRRLPPLQLVAPTPQLLKELSRAATSLPLRWLLAHCDWWGVRHLVLQILAVSPGELAAMVRSTVAVTDLTASPPGHNVIPDTATAHVNFRVLPGEDPEFGSKYLRARARAASVAVELHVTEASQASTVTDVRSKHWAQIKAAILAVFAPPQGMLVLPELLAGVTDSANWAREFPGVDILRFVPMGLNRTAGDIKRIHGVDERVACDAYLDGVRFYAHYLQTIL